MDNEADHWPGCPVSKWLIQDDFADCWDLFWSGTCSSRMKSSNSSVTFISCNSSFAILLIWTPFDIPSVDIKGLLRKLRGTEESHLLYHCSIWQMNEDRTIPISSQPHPYSYRVESPSVTPSDHAELTGCCFHHPRHNGQLGMEGHKLRACTAFVLKKAQCIASNYHLNG